MMVEDSECAVDEVNISKVSILQYFLVIQSVYLKKNNIQQISHIIHPN